MGEESDAIKYSESPTPKIKGLPNLAAISLSGSSCDIATIPYAPTI